MNFRDKIHLPDAVRQFLAETLGTFLLVLFGDGAIAQKIGMGETNFLHIAFGYGFALMIGILVSGGVSGGHLNPAVTLTMAVLKKCKWIQVPIYMAGQYLGAFLASAVLYGVYADMIT
jgi:glycerol uptake facilitator-like aquaporin